MNDHNERLISSLGAFAAVIILILCLFVETPYPLDRQMTRWSGFALVIVGMLLVVWAATYLGRAISGEITPVLDYFIAQGPYGFVRHPVYLGLTIAMLGLTFAFNSWLATLAVLFLFLPGQVIRARLEEQALLLRFGDLYDAYRQQTGFIFPKLSHN